MNNEILKGYLKGSIAILSDKYIIINDNIKKELIRRIEMSIEKIEKQEKELKELKHILYEEHEKSIYKKELKNKYIEKETIRDLLIAYENEVLEKLKN